LSRRGKPRLEIDESHPEVLIREKRRRLSDDCAAKDGGRSPGKKRFPLLREQRASIERESFPRGYTSPNLLNPRKDSGHLAEEHERGDLGRGGCAPEKTLLLPLK